MFWQIKKHTLAGIFGFVGAKNSIFKSCCFKKVFFAIFGTYKSNANTTDLTTTLIKQM
jgi:hypothetical protein